MRVPQSIGLAFPPNRGIEKPKIERYGTTYPISGTAPYAPGIDKVGHTEYGSEAIDTKDREGYNPVLQHSAPLTYSGFSRIQGGTSAQGSNASGASSGRAAVRSLSYRLPEAIEGGRLRVKNRYPDTGIDTVSPPISPAHDPRIVIGTPLPFPINRSGKRNTPISIYRAQHTRLIPSRRGMKNINPDDTTSPPLGVNPFHDSTIGNTASGAYEESSENSMAILSNPIVIIVGLLIGYLIIRR
jgi:hypothetical protein